LLNGQADRQALNAEGQQIQFDWRHVHKSPALRRSWEIHRNLPPADVCRNHSNARRCWFVLQTLFLQVAFTLFGERDSRKVDLGWLSLALNIFLYRLLDMCLR
jgi:hypothetical protein